MDPPEHRLSVRVVEQETAAPVENALVRPGPYRTATGGSGIAELALPKGSYALNVWKSGYEAPITAITVDADLAVDRHHAGTGGRSGPAVADVMGRCGDRPGRQATGQS